ncbi:hypothetical protein M5K25_021279 [Dendrobium thyrsiflorum]|uniref:Transposase n=1 Tax=Dendrobium thyrsiflorum TaxID=117978 RepID=A0ABD0UJ13_DENTH
MNLRRPCREALAVPMSCSSRELYIDVRGALIFNPGYYHSCSASFFLLLVPIFRSLPPRCLRRAGKGVACASSSTPHRSTVDVSIYSGQPKCTTRNPKWPEEHNVVVGKLLLEQYVNRNFCNGNLRKDQWSILVAALNRRLGSNYTESSIMIQFKNMKSDFRALYQLTNHSGWGWDDDLHMPIAPDELWDEIVQVHPKLLKFRKYSFNQYEIFEKICAENIAIGTGARCSKASQPSVNLNEDKTQYFEDEFMTANGVSYNIEETPNSILPDVVDEEPPSVDVQGSAMLRSKRSSEKSPKSNRRPKKKGPLNNLNKLLVESNKKAVVFKETVQRSDPYTMIDCLDKLGKLENLTTQALLALQDAFKENNDAIAEINPSLIQDNSSSDDELPIRRPMLPPDAFMSLRDLLVSRGHLHDTKNMLAAEQLGIFLRGVAHAHSYRQLCEFFQHSTETVSRYFNLVIRAIVSFADEFINLPQAEIECHPFVRSNALFYPYFKNAIGAIDGTHITAVVSNNLQNRYQNRKGFTSQKVMAAVSFDRQFVYIASGWEGSAADMRVLKWAVEQGQFAMPRNHYYLVSCQRN